MQYSGISVSMLWDSMGDAVSMLCDSIVVAVLCCETVQWSLQSTVALWCFEMQFAVCSLQFAVCSLQLQFKVQFAVDSTVRVTVCRAVCIESLSC